MDVPPGMGLDDPGDWYNWWLDLHPSDDFAGHLASLALNALSNAPLGSVGTETLRFDVTPTLLAALAWSVLVMSMAAIALLMLLIRRGEVSRVAALIYLVPPLAAAEAFVLFGERLDAVQIVGMAVTAMGVWLSTRLK